MSTRPPLDEVRLVDVYIDARHAGTDPPVPLDPALAALVDRLADLPADAWPPPVAGGRWRRPSAAGRLALGRPLGGEGRLAGPTGGRAGRGVAARRVVVAAAAVVLLAGVLVLVSVGGPNPPRARPPATGISWRLAGYLDQPAWQAGPTSPVAVAPTVACPSPGECSAATTAVAGVPVERTTDGGALWSATATPAGVWLTSGLTCPAASSCAVAGVADLPAGASQPAGGVGELLVTADGGAHWAVEPLPPGLARATDLACTDLGHCVAAGFGPSAGGGPTGPAVSAVTTDGGAHWVLSGLPPTFTPRVLTGLQCPSPTACVMVGLDQSSGVDRPAAVFSTDGGGSWSPSSLPAALPTGSVWSVSCGEAASCTALVPSAAPGEPTSALSPTQAVTTTDGGRTWQPAAPFAGGSVLLTALSCVGPSSCWATGEQRSSSTGPALLGAIESTADGGRTWTVATLPPAGTPSALVGAVTSVACADDGSCVALAATLQPGGTGQLVLRSSPTG